MELIDFLSRVKNKNTLIEEAKKFIKDKYKTEPEFYEIEKAKELLNVKELKEIIVDKKVIQKNGETLIPIFDDEKIYGVMKIRKSDKDLMDFIPRFQEITRNLLNSFRLYEDAEKELFKLKILFDLHKALESNVPENLKNVFKDIMFLRDLKGVYLKTKKYEIKLGSLENIDSDLISRERPDFETKGEVLEIENKKFYSFTSEISIVLIDTDHLEDEDKEFFSSITSLLKEWEEEKFPFSLEVLEKILGSDFEECFRILCEYIKNEFNLHEPKVYLRENEKWKVHPVEEKEYIELEEISDSGETVSYYVKGRISEAIITEKTKEKKELPYFYLSFLFDFINIKRKIESLSKLNHVLKRIIEIVPKVKEIDDFLQIVGQIIKEELEVHYVGVLLKESEDYIRMRVGIGYERYEELLKIRLKIGVQGLSGYVAKTGETLYVPDVSKDPRYREASPKVKSEVAVPLKFEDEVLGVMVISSPRVDGFTKEDISIFEGIAGLISFFIREKQEVENLRNNLEKLKEEEKFMDVILKNIPVGIIYADKNLLVKRANKAALYTLGIDEEEIKDTVLCQIFEAHEPGSPDCIFRRSMEERMPLIKQNVNITRNGESIPLSLSSTFIYEGESIRGLLLMVEDIREVVALEEQLRRTERLSAIGRIAAHMAHEIKNPLASISVGIEFIYSSLKDDDPKKKHLGVILKEIQRLDRLIKNLLSFARRPPLKRKKLNLKELIEEIVIFHNQEFKEKKIELKLDLPDKDVYAFADEDQIKEVFENLIRNAIEAMPDGGELKIKVGEKSGGVVSIMIEDTGPGIEPSELQHIFEPFYTTKKGGSGLGLSIVHRVIEDHGGRISVESEKGKGTRFIIDLPV